MPEEIYESTNLKVDLESLQLERQTKTDIGFLPARLLSTCADQASHLSPRGAD
jgi:hypothetical protein